jgi:histone deacetylase complex regulatory component SIN3
LHADTLPSLQQLFKGGKLSTHEGVSKIHALFAGKPDLISGFGIFLPQELQTTATTAATTDTLAATTAAAATDAISATAAGASATAADATSSTDADTTAASATADARATASETAKVG